MFSPFGQFSADGKSFIINTPDIPRNWYNYFYTDHYVTFTSQCGIGQGFLQDDLGCRLMSVTARGMYAVTEDAAWNLCGLPVYEKKDFYECVHTLGSTTIKLTAYNGKYATCTVTVKPAPKTVKLDKTANKVRGEVKVISAKGSKIPVIVLPTNEELMIARDTVKVLEK